ncbi:MAG: PilZ domain-containing protein [Henriciella sp.]|nr:PilZ domain-containing protein [Henriciella sp.]
MNTALQTVPTPKRAPRSKPDRRRHHRVALHLRGRFMSDNADHSLQTIDISCGGAKVRSEIMPAKGDPVVCYFDDLGRVSAQVVRHLDDGFAVSFDASAHKRDKLADRLIWLINHKKFNLTDERAAPRNAAGGPALVTRSDGTKLQCRVIDISMTGAAFEHEGAIPVIGERVRAGTITGEVVRSVSNEFAIRFLIKAKK